MNNITLYKRSGTGQILVWVAEIYDNKLTVSHGTLGGVLTSQNIVSSRPPVEEATSRSTKKRKEGYKSVEDIHENGITLNNSIGDNYHNLLYKYLDTYLPKYNTDNNGNIMPMLATKYDAEKAFKVDRFGQWKINGLRCLISAVEPKDSLFECIRLEFRSREGGRFNLPVLEAYILNKLSSQFKRLMLEEGYVLDGELYLPGFAINDINSAVKTASHPMHDKVQYFCYDLAIENMKQINRLERLQQHLGCETFYRKEDHLNNKNLFVLIPCTVIHDSSQAIEFRNHAIDLGFEGLILRDMSGEYQFGKRNSTMIKYKKIYDGIFEIVAIGKEKKRDLPLFTLRNDINDATFEVKIIGSFEEQRLFLDNNIYIGKKMKVEYRERSGVNALPFHAIGIQIIY